MTTAEYNPGDTLTDEQGKQITVIRQVHDGRYEVAYDRTRRTVLSGRTIRALYPIAALVVALSLAFAGVASAATPLAKAKAIVHAQVYVQKNAAGLTWAANHNFVGGSAGASFTIECRGTTSIYCSIDGSGGSYYETFAVKHGVLHGSGIHFLGTS